MAHKSNLRLISSAITLLFWAILSFSCVLAAQEPRVYPGKLGIAGAKNLSPQEKQVEARFVAYLEAHTDEAIARYVERYGKEINSDNARELSSDYAPGGMDAEDPATVAARTQWGESVHEPASALAREIYRRALKKDSAPGRHPRVVLTAGGAGAGKTTSIRKLAELARAVQAADIVYDTTLSSVRSAVERIAQALDARRMVSIFLVYRDPIDAFVNGVLPRATSMGRTVLLEVFLDTHMAAVEVFPRIADSYKDDPRVAITVIDNHETENAIASDLKFIETIGRKYSRAALKIALLRALDDAHEKGKKGGANGISESVYRAIKGRAP